RAAMTVRAACVQIGAGARVERSVLVARGGERRQDIGVADRRDEKTDRVEGLELVRGASGARIRERTVELRRLEAERRAGRGAMAGDAVAAAWEYPLGVADLDARSARVAPRVRSVGAPFVAEAAPRAARMMHQQARLDERAVETQVLGEHGARREHPAVAVVDRERGAVGQREHP